MRFNTFKEIADGRMIRVWISKIEVKAGGSFDLPAAPKCATR